MNLMPTLISIGLAASVSLFYLQNQSDKPKEINYRAALSEFEQSAIAFAAHTPLDSNNPQPQSHCENNMVSDFSKRLPAGSQWTVNIAGLDCDTAILSLTSADSDDFNNLLSAASASGRSYATETDTSVTPPTKTIKWTQRLYTRTASDLGIRAQLKNNRTNSCLDNPCSDIIPMPVGAWQKKGGCSKTCDGGIQQYECIGGKCSQTKPNTQCNTDPCPAIGKWQEDGCTETCGTGIQQYKCIGGECNTPKPSQSCNTNPCPVNGGWSHKDEDDWEGCPAMPTCGSFTETRQCNKPTPQNGGNHCKKLNGTLTTDSNLSETRDCRKIGSCGLWGGWSEPDKKCITENEPDQTLTQTCNGKDGCKNDQNVFFKHNELDTKSVNLPKCTWTDWGEWSECDVSCGEYGKQSRTRNCTNNTLNCNREEKQWQSCKGSCGVWKEKNQCPTSTCLKPGDTPLIKQICDGTDKEYQCINTDTGDTYMHNANEYCGTPRCGEWTELQKCPEINTTCQADDANEVIKYLKCDGIRCERNNLFFKNGYLLTESCNLPKCGEWSNWSKCATSKSNDSNTTKGSCHEPKGIKKRECNAEFCIDTNTSLAVKSMQEMCLTESCEIDLPQTDREILITDLVKNPNKRNVTVNVLANNTIMAPSTDKCAIRTGKDFKKLTIRNAGKIYGAAGKGGKGATADINNINGSNGHNGGPAICIESANVQIVGSGIILGGSGGGGGGGGVCGYIDSKYTCVAGGNGTDGVARNLDQPPPMKEENWGKKSSEFMTVLKGGDGGKGGFGEQPAEKGWDASDEWDWIPFRDSTIGNGGKAGETGEKCATAPEIKSKVGGC